MGTNLYIRTTIKDIGFPGDGVAVDSPSQIEASGG